MTRQEKLLSAIGLALFALVCTLAFRAYFSPEMLVEFVMRLCG
jgi:hypothetical protein